jgi:hypothetical protein
MGKSGRVFVRGLTSQTYGLGSSGAVNWRSIARDDTIVVDDEGRAPGDSEKSRTCGGSARR